jgi:hypothetical protein
MSVANLQQVFLWCTVINYCLLILWWAIIMLPHKWIYNLSGKHFGCSEAQFDSYNLIGIIFYKMSIVLLFLVPYIAMKIVG